jgi:hypothetical protein
MGDAVHVTHLGGHLMQLGLVKTLQLDEGLP